MFEYVDRVMQNRAKAFRHVILNVYGGESLHHPQIVEILQQVHQRYQPYQSQWSLKVTCTTNGIVPRRKLQSIIPLINEFTMSYHSEVSDKYKTLFKQNLLEIKNSGKDLKCIILMHSDAELFKDSQQMITWLAQHNIRHLPRQLDHLTHTTEFNYENSQVQWFKKIYQEKSYNGQGHEFVPVQDQTGKSDLADTGRACCGGRQLCMDQNYKVREYFVKNKFPGWYCSVDKFFLFIKQVNGEVFSNRDCKVNYQGQVAPIGNLNDTAALLDLVNKNLTIQCVKDRCHCGLCAPKAQSRETFNQIMRKYEISNSNLLS